MALYGNPPGVAWAAPPSGHHICRQCKTPVHCKSARCKGCNAITEKGKRNHTIAQLAQIHGMSEERVARRLSRGLPPDAVLQIGGRR